MNASGPGRGRAARAGRLRIAAFLLALAWSATAAWGLDQPISGRTVKLKSTASGPQLVFVSDDPAAPFPAIGSPDDPASGERGGMVVEVFSRAEGPRTATAPPGIGNPGWKVFAGRTDAYRYRNAGGVAVSRVRKALLAEGRRLRVRADAGLGLAMPLGAVAIRVTTGFLRSCALFDAGSVRRDVAGAFFATGAPAPPLPDCSDESLLGALGFDCGASGVPACDGSCPADGTCVADVAGGGVCKCVFSSQPCGGANAPLCNGECPAGEQCYAMDNFIPGAVNDCRCAPVGEPPCGATGVCGGGCPDELECASIPGFGIYDPECTCLEPDQRCGPGFGDCPPDLVCSPLPGASGFSCIPIFCGGTSPGRCDAACSDGRVCVPLDVAGVHLCVCATPSLSCDEGLACGEGLACPEGEVCTLATSGSGPPTCSCEPQ
jgi:hypothetical protein